MRRWMVTGCLLMALGAPVYAEGTPGGSVTIPLDQFIKLTHPTQVSHTGAPLPYILASGNYRFTPQQKWMQVDGDITLRLYDSGWVEVPLMANGVVVTEVTLDGQPLPLFVKDDKYTLVANGVGSHRIKVRYHLPLNASGATTSVQATLPFTSVSTASLTLPESHLRLSASPNVPLTTEIKAGKTVVSASIPSGQDQGGVTFSWTPERTNPLLHGKQNHEKPLIEARTYMLITVSDKVLRTHSRINCAILRNETDRLVFDIPAGTEVVDLQCPHLANYNVTDEKGYRRVNVSFSEPVSGQQAVEMTTEKALDAVNGSWDVPTLALEEAARVKGSIGIETTGGIEVSLADLHDLRGIDVKELPAEVTAMSTSPIVLAYEYHKQPYRLALSSQKGEELPVLTATIDTAQGMTLVTPEGKMVTRMTYMVRNNLKQNLTLRLPVGATVWSAYVNGEPVKPVKTTDGAIKLPLLRSQSNGDGMATFPAELTFVSEAGTQSIVGQRTMQAPECDVPISQMSWSVYLPKQCHVLRFGGSMQPATDEPVFATSEPLGALREGLAAKKMPSAADVVNNVANAAPAGAPMSRAESILKTEGTEVDSKDLSQMVNTARQGAFPVRVFVPQVGHAYYFSSLMVAKQMPTIVIYYSDDQTEALVGGLGVFFGLLGLAGMARRYGWSAHLTAFRHRLHPVEPLPTVVG